MNTPAPVALQVKTHRGDMSRVWDQLSLYLPVLMMMLLALVSYLLLQATPLPLEPEPERLVTNEPDFFMRRFSVKVFAPDGVLQTEVYGAEARHHPDTDLTVIDTARIRTFSAQRQLSTATAREIVSNGEGTVYELRGDAVVVREAASGRVVYETRASHTGPWSDSVPIFATLFQAALANFPNPPAGLRRVNIELPR